MVAMRQRWNDDRGGRDHVRVEQDMDAINKDSIEATLAACVQRLSRDLGKTLEKERGRLALLSDEAWLAIARNAIFDIAKILNFHDANRDGEEPTVFKRIRDYERFADRDLWPEFMKICKNLNEWREEPPTPSNP